MILSISNLFIITNPFEQFEIFIFWNFVHTLFLFYFDFFVIFIFLFGLGLSRLRFMNSMYQLLLHNLYIFILSLFHQHIGVKNSIKFMSLISTIFIFILFCNFIGLFPYGFAITSHMLVTFGLSVSIFVGIVIFSFWNHGLYFFSFFVPSNVPIFLLGFIILIEILSYLIRPFSLGIRLFANLLSGHTLLSLVSAFVFFLWKYYITLVFIPFLIIICIIGLEIGVAFIQSYVFTVLVCIYIADSFNIKH